MTADEGDDGVDDAVHHAGHNGGKRAADDHADGHVKHIAAHDELFEIVDPAGLFHGNYPISL